MLQFTRDDILDARKRALEMAARTTAVSAATFENASDTVERAKAYAAFLLDPNDGTTLKAD